MKIFNLKFKNKIKLSGLGFTNQEQQVILFLLITFLVGSFVWGYRHYFSPLPLISKPAEVVINSNLEIIEEQEINTCEVIHVNINRATQLELETLPGIGIVKAKKIIEYRKIHGEFKSLSDLENVSGIGKKILENLKQFIYL